MSLQKISILIDTDADPSTLLDAAYEFAEELVEEHGGTFRDEDGASVEYVAPREGPCPTCGATQEQLHRKASCAQPG